MSARSTPSNNGERKPPGILRDDADARVRNGEIPIVLPHERVFRIQIGSELFTLSGASLSSDGKQNAFYLIIIKPPFIHSSMELSVILRSTLPKPHSSRREIVASSHLRDSFLLNHSPIRLFYPLSKQISAKHP